MKKDKLLKNNIKLLFMLHFLTQISPNSKLRHALCREINQCLTMANQWKQENPKGKIARHGKFILDSFCAPFRNK